MEVMVPGRSRSQQTPSGTAAKQQKVAPPPPTAEAPPRYKESGDMECEDISEFPKHWEFFSAPQHTTFEEHLRMIDSKIGFTTAYPTDPHAPAGPLTSQAHGTFGLPPCMINKEPTRPITNIAEDQPLGDLTNMHPSPNPPRKNGTGTWKKKALAHGSNSGQAPLITLKKRSWDENQAPNEEGGRQGKVARILQHEYISAAAVPQPRREQ
ncbi:hypothetical protein FCV25MIE_02270 [Fagus crenata]